MEYQQISSARKRKLERRGELCYWLPANHFANPVDASGWFRLNPGFALPDGCWYASDGTVSATCKSCDNPFRVEEVSDFHPDYAYCCRSDRCMP